jgi:hypothetical protein
MPVIKYSIISLLALSTPAMAQNVVPATPEGTQKIIINGPVYVEDEMAERIENRQRNYSEESADNDDIHKMHKHKKKRDGQNRRVYREKRGTDYRVKD